MLGTASSAKVGLFASVLLAASKLGVGAKERGERHIRCDRRARSSGQAAEIIRKPERRTSSYRAA